MAHLKSRVLGHAVLKIRINKSSTPGAGSKVECKPGVYTSYKPYLQRDKTLLKLIAKGTQTRRPSQVQSALIRRHFLELTQSFVIPLERYIARLMPLQKSISPYKVPYMPLRLLTNQHPATTWYVYRPFPVWGRSRRKSSWHLSKTVDRS